MVALAWDQAGERNYEAGVDRGVLYLPDGSGVAWNGLIAVDENNNNTVEASYWDGIKYNDLITIGEYSGVLRAYTYPDEFLPFDGIQEDQKGVLITDQVPDRFHLCYRTLVGSDSEGTDAGYKIHIVYNLTANAAVRQWQTMSLDIAPIEFEWTITAIPEEIDGHRPTAHIIFDSRHIDPWLMEDLEEILYGNATNDATLPDLKALTTFIRKWDRLIIVDHGDGTWSAISQDDDIIEVDGNGLIQIHADPSLVNIIDADTYEISSSDKNEEDIYP